MNEQEFIESIDCSFPYKDDVRALEIIHQARDISLNATFMVLHEIVRAPCEVDVSLRNELYEKWLHGFNHDSLPLVREAAESILGGSELAVSRAQELMREMQSEVGQYCALSIIYFSCDDQDDKLEHLYNEIIEQW